MPLTAKQRDDAFKAWLSSPDHVFFQEDEKVRAAFNAGALFAANRVTLDLMPPNPSNFAHPDDYSRAKEKWQERMGLTPPPAPAFTFRKQQ